MIVITLRKSYLLKSPAIEIHCILFFDCSTHPYLFFNPDHETLSFLGFKVDEDGNAEFLDPQTGEIIRKSLMPRRLRTGLFVQNVDLNHDFDSKNK